MGRINSQQRFERFNAYLTKTSQTAQAGDWRNFDRFFLTTDGADEPSRFERVVCRLAGGESPPETKADKKLATAKAAKPAKASKAKTPAPAAEATANAMRALTGVDETAPAPAAAAPPPPDQATVARRQRWAATKRIWRAASKTGRAAMVAASAAQ
jgi:hypothetical protein